MAYDGPIPLGVPSGGTGRATITSGAVISGNGSGNVLVSSQGSAGQVFVCQTASTSGQYITPTAGTGLSVTTNASTLSWALSTPVSVANGGTGASSFTAYMPVVGGTTSTNPLQSVAVTNDTAPNFLMGNGSAALPTWTTIPLYTDTANYSYSGGF